MDRSNTTTFGVRWLEGLTGVPRRAPWSVGVPNVDDDSGVVNHPSDTANPMRELRLEGCAQSGRDMSDPMDMGPVRVMRVLVDVLDEIVPGCRAMIRRRGARRAKPRCEIVSDQSAKGWAYVFGVAGGRSELDGGLCVEGAADLGGEANGPIELIELTLVDELTLSHERPAEGVAVSDPNTR